MPIASQDFSQKAQAFFLGHIHAYEYFGGVSEKSIPDNTKAAVIEASYQDPVINRAYHELAEHYGFLISPCPPYQPRKKGGVENDIKYVKNNFWPLFKEKQKALGREVPHFEDLAAELEALDAGSLGDTADPRGGKIARGRSSRPRRSRP